MTPWYSTRMHYVALPRLMILLSLANGSPVIAKQIFGETRRGDGQWRDRSSSSTRTAAVRECGYESGARRRVRPASEN
jgi:hypothetical protein